MNRFALWLAILLVPLSCLIAQTNKDIRTSWFELNAGTNELLYKTSHNIGMKLGYNFELAEQYHLALNLSFNEDFAFGFSGIGYFRGDYYPAVTGEGDTKGSSNLTNLKSYAVDLQVGKLVDWGFIAVYPALGIGYADLLDEGGEQQVGTNPPNSGRTIAIPVSCNLRFDLLKHFGIQGCAYYNFNTIESFQGFYGGIVIGGLVSGPNRIKFKEYWFDAGLGFNNQATQKSYAFSQRHGFSMYIAQPYYISLHLASGADTSGEGILGYMVGTWGLLGVDLQAGRTFPLGKFCISPAAGIGFANIGKSYRHVGENYMSTGTDESSALTLPLACEVSYPVSSKTSIQTTATYSINSFRSYYGLYAGINIKN